MSSCLRYIYKTFYTKSKIHFIKQTSLKTQQNIRTITLSVTSRYASSFNVKDIRFNGVFATVSESDEDLNSFEHDLETSLNKWKVTKRSVFLQIPISQSHLIVISAKHGFTFHHSRNDYSVLKLWLDETTESRIPQYANHQVGVAGACFNDRTSELLVVQDTGRFSDWWKFPGGFSELGEFIGETAVREVQEETDIQSEFKSVLSIRQQHGVSFGQSDFYFICRLHPLTFELKPCPHEIKDCKWIHTDELKTMQNSTPFVKLVCDLILQGHEEGFQHVDIVGQEMQSWVFKNKQFMLFHRPIIEI